MTACQVGPRYCPKCGKELPVNASLCISCGFRLKKEKVRHNFFPPAKERGISRLNIKDIIKQVSTAAKGKDNFEKGTVGFYGYGFVFRDLNYINKFIDFHGTGGVYHLGVTRERLKDFKRNINVLEHLSDYDRHYDLRLIGSIRTLVPTMIFGGGYEHLFEVWMFIKTFDRRQFPATIYYGASGLSIGGWDANFAYDFTHNEKFLSIFPEEFKSEVNFSPYNLSDDEKEALAEAIELGLRKVPVSDFSGIYKHDFGNTFMGIKDSKPFIIELGFSPKYRDIELVLNLGMKFNISRKEFMKWDIH